MKTNILLSAGAVYLMMNTPGCADKKEPAIVQAPSEAECHIAHRDVYFGDNLTKCSDKQGVCYLFEHGISCIPKKDL